MLYEVVEKMFVRVVTTGKLHQGASQVSIPITLERRYFLLGWEKTLGVLCGQLQFL